MSGHMLSHDEAEFLLPWYANGTLEGMELERMAEHVDTCEICRADLAIVRSMIGAVNDPAAVPIVPKPDPAKLLALLDRPGRAISRRTKSVWMIAAALAVLFVAGFLYSGFQFGDVPNRLYSTATSANPRNVVHYVLQIEFDAGTAPATRMRILDEIGAINSAETGATNRLRVVVPLGASSLADLEAFTSEVRDRKEVISVEVVAIELPVEPRL